MVNFVMYSTTIKKLKKEEKKATIFFFPELVISCLGAVVSLLCFLMPCAEESSVLFSGVPAMYVWPDSGRNELDRPRFRVTL